MFPFTLLEGKDRFWVSNKTRPTQFATNKNAPGVDYSDPKTPIHTSQGNSSVEELPEGCTPGGIDESPATS